MKALIFNSGTGSRLGELTAHNPKCMVRLTNGETIFHRQLRVLHACGIREFVVTTGPFPEQLEEVAREFEAKGCSFAFVRNDRYDQTNYIWSMWLARDLIAGNEILMLHGDLVFDAAYVAKLLALPAGSWGSVNPALPLPEKDFKARVVDGTVREVGVGIFGDDCLTFQALYRLTPEAVRTWLDAIGGFVARGETGVYAENAANTVFEAMGVRTSSYEDHVVEEIDTPEDLERVGALIRDRDFADQPVLACSGRSLALSEGTCVPPVSSFAQLLSQLGASHPLVVTNPYFATSYVRRLMEDTPVYDVFTGFDANPVYEQVLEGVRLFRERGCDALVSVGGGSAIDIAKCIKLFAPMDSDGVSPRFVELPRAYSPLPHIAIPTTAGTGSESTHFAVLYVDGVKNSISQPCLQPDAAVLDASLLVSLPEYQKKATLLDALCQAIESYWSVKSSPASRAYARAAIPLVVNNHEAYLAGSLDACEKVLQAANLAGKAINLTTTTAAHAMSYKITSLYGAAHGHAVALCLPFTWRVLMERGDEQVQERLAQIAALLVGRPDATAAEGLARFEAIRDGLGILPTIVGSPDDLDLLARSVNPERLGNFPVALGPEELRDAYASIVVASRDGGE